MTPPTRPASRRSGGPVDLAQLVASTTDATLPRASKDTWLPVVDRQKGWSKVLLPSRPNGSTGWLKTAQLVQRQTPYLIRVHVGSRQLELLRDDEPDQSFSPLILPLGSHSDTLDSYGGGPGTVALHGWPDTSVFGSAISHGCVRVPAEALEQLREVPLGTLVIVDQQ